MRKCDTGNLAEHKGQTGAKGERRRVSTFRTENRPHPCFYSTTQVKCCNEAMHNSIGISLYLVQSPGIRRLSQDVQ